MNNSVANPANSQRKIKFQLKSEGSEIENVWAANPFPQLKSRNPSGFKMIH